MAEPGLVAFEFTPETEALFVRIERRLQAKEIFARFLDLFDRLGPVVAGHIIRTTLSGQVLARRTGTLARSIFGRGEIVNRLPALRVGVFQGPAARYAGVHEHGATIRPKKAKALAIPVSKDKGGSGRALTPAGVSRFVSPRQYPGQLRYIPINRGKVVAKLVDERDIEDMAATYLLLRKVEIPRREPIRKGLVTYLPKIADAMAKAMREFLLGN